jgi:antitoxin VapB
MLALSEDTEALAQRLAALNQRSVDATVRLALEAEARTLGVAFEPRDRSAEAVAVRLASTDRLIAEFAAMPVLDPRSPREIMDELNSP